MTEVYLYDTTLRDGAQQEGISLSLDDKLKITKKLDEAGISYIEGGWPGSNPKDEEYFKRVKNLRLNHSIVTSFGSTRKVNTQAHNDANLLSLVESETKIATIVGKTWDLHVTDILNTDLQEGLSMISDSIAFLKSKGQRVFLDAEHFFDGFKSNKDFTLQCLKKASESGVECIVLCDTNGGSMPSEIQQIIQEVKNNIDTELGIHTHNDCELAVANSLIAVDSGVTQVQGTLNGYGERCGNANILSIAANLSLKMNIEVLNQTQLSRLTELHKFASEIINIPPNNFQPYVGANAFNHKGGLHASAVMKLADSYQHIKPELVGNTTGMTVSELSGRGNITFKLKELGFPSNKISASVADLSKEIKIRESKGYQYEGAEASFELLAHRNINEFAPMFELIDYRVIVESKSSLIEDTLTEATVKLRIGSEIRHTASVGNGPVNAIDLALRKALLQDFPTLDSVRLTDYKVRVIDQGSGTEAFVRVLIDSTDGNRSWQTMGASTNIIEASWIAVVDSLEYWNLHTNK